MNVDLTTTSTQRVRLWIITYNEELSLLGSLALSSCYSSKGQKEQSHTAQRTNVSGRCQNMIKCDFIILFSINVLIFVEFVWQNNEYVPFFGHVCVCAVSLFFATFPLLPFSFSYVSIWATRIRNVLSSMSVRSIRQRSINQRMLM